MCVCVRLALAVAEILLQCVGREGTGGEEGGLMMKTGHWSADGTGIRSQEGGARKGQDKKEKWSF